jgi:formylglycine-generating enzyme required for sulfatase activity
MLTETYFAAMVKVFISYSHDDKEFCDNIKKYLKQFRDSVEIWADHEIKAGEEWDKTIEENLKEADIILFLVSVNFINSGYIKDNELAVGYARRQGGSAEIIPILLTECEWKRVDELARFQALPIDPSDKRAQYIDKWDEDKRAPVYNSIAVEINERASILIKNRQVREKNDKLQRYREKCQEFLSKSPDLKLSISDRHSLAEFWKDNGIGEAEATKVFEEVQEPYRVRKKNCERYLETVKAYLSDRRDLSAEQTKRELKDRQLALKLVDDDIKALQPEIDRLADEQRAKEEEERKARDQAAKPKADAERLASDRPVREQQAPDQALQQVPKQAQSQKQPDLQTLSISSAVLVQDSRVLKRLLGPSWLIDRDLVQVKVYQQPLAEGPEITMVQIPAGSFQMGSPDTEAERQRNEGPQHRVELQSFFLGQTPITQAQWQAVASWPQVEMKLNSDPAEFKFEGSNKPVAQVSWEEAMEFCRRLSQRSKLVYTLPSEAQWEYACRAGTTTPFYFGDTVSTELANYIGIHVYGDGHKGEWRMETTDVASFPANPWGLHDMHGNVWEWCLDPWHDSYRGAPADGSAWTAGGGVSRLLRGGSWESPPADCRSASRYFLPPDARYNGRPVSRDIPFGFRVCCLPQD